MSHGKSLVDLLRFMTHSFSPAPFVVASVFPLSSNKNGNFGLDHEQDDDAFFLPPERRTFINVGGRKPTYQVV